MTQMASADEPVGGVVRELKESPRRPGRYTVVLSSGQQCVVGVETLSATGATRVGAALDGTQVARLVRGSAVTALMDRALNTLARGGRTRRELEVRLRRVEPDALLIAEALDRLMALGAVSDAGVARAEASARLRRGQAPTLIRQSLRKKGIDSPGAERAIRDAIDENGFDELEACRKQAVKRWSALRSLDRGVARRRLIGFLLRRGYAGSIASQVLGELERT